MHSIASTESGFWTTSNIAHMSAAAPSSPQLPLLSRHERCDCGLSHLTLYTQTQHSSQPATADLATPCRHSYGIFVPPAHDHNAKCYSVDNVDMLLEKCVTRWQHYLRMFSCSTRIRVSQNLNPPRKCTWVRSWHYMRGRVNVQTVEDNKDDKIVLVVLKIFSVVRI